MKALPGMIIPLLFFTACVQTDPSTSRSSTSSSSEANDASEALTLQLVSPSAGTRSALPPQVTLVFNKTSLVAGVELGSVALASSYQLVCDSSTYAIPSVSYSSGSSSVLVSLPVLSDLTEGTSCTLELSSEIRDSYGNYLSGDRSFAYTLAASYSWSPNSSATYTSTAGGSGGASFSDIWVGSSVLSGLKIYQNSMVVGVQGIWRSGFAYGSTQYNGSGHGTLSGAVNNLACPAGMRITGLRGWASGSYIYGLGIVCKDVQQTQVYYSNIVGQDAGSSFSLDCSTGRFAVYLAGKSGAYVDQLQLGCK